MISAENINCAKDKVHKMDIAAKESICDEIFHQQPNILASVLVQEQMGSTIEEVDILLNILMVLYISVKESGNKLNKISADDQELQLEILSATIKFSEKMGSESISRSVNQFVKNHSEPLLLAYTLSTLKNAHFFSKNKDSSKYLILAGINLANCIANAQTST
jgi:hypothetical protein